MVGKMADLLGKTTPRRRVRLPILTVASKEVMAARDEFFVALMRHWCAPSPKAAKAVVEALALLTVGGKLEHPYYAPRVKRLAKAMEAGKLQRLPAATSTGLRSRDVVKVIDSLGEVAGSLSDAAAAFWPSAAWNLGGLRSLTWPLSQSVPDGLDLADPDSAERLARAWDQARRWRTSQQAPVLVMTVNQAKNLEFEDVVVYVDGFQNQIRGPITESNRMQMYVAVSRGRRSVKVIWAESKQTKPSDLLATVIPRGRCWGTEGPI